MKKIYTILFLFALSTTLCLAQNKDTKKADALYNRLQYTDAAQAYQKLLKKGKGSRYVFEQLGNSYYNINDTKKSETYYKRVVKGRNVNPETVYNYAQSLKANGKFSDYNIYMKQFAKALPNDSRAIEFMKNPNYVPKLMEERPQFSATNMKEINTEFSEFGGVLVGKDFYFSSARNTTRKKYGWNEEPYLDIYRAEDVGGTIKNAELLENGDVNTKYHEGNIAITNDGKRMYFDRNDYYRGKYDKSAEGVNQINIFYAEWVDGKWQDVQSVSINSSEYSSGHPALSPDGNTLYFVSDMPGGMGMSDIYKVAVSKDGSLGTPMPLGKSINTEGKEVFPFIDANGDLYFASTGHMGLGGLDVFYAPAEGDGFGAVKNLGPGINTSEDDFAFIYNPNTELGYLSSNRTGGMGSDDIYTTKKLEPPCEVQMLVTVVNEYTKAPLAGARVDFYDTLGNKLSTKTSGEDGSVTFIAECDIAHEVQAVLTEFESNAITMEKANNTTIEGTILLRPIEEIIVDDKVVLNPIYFPLDKSNITPKAAFELDKLVALMKKYPNMVIKAESHTDSRSSDKYNLELSERRAQSTVQYVISKGIDASRISGEGFGESKPKIACGANCTEAQHQQNRRSEFIIVKR
ncbi:MAG: cell envelope biogenesis protein OmpA [Flavobacteriaceae bacterium]|nr:cell envelope biogenesis protein OmpA [Flavobacteriaceae bacterium]|tara:strand:- start:47575 stop:49470 length:1896 start_codon:yes stop_codon:yes gene_type:complete